MANGDRPGTSRGARGPEPDISTDVESPTAPQPQAAPTAAAVAEPPASGPDVVDWQPEDPEYAPPVEAPQYKGTKTRLRLAYPLMRDQRIVGAGEHILVEAAFDPVTRQWYGPEAPHLEQLFALGLIAGSRQARERDEQTAVVETQRGVHNPLERDQDGKVIQRPMVEFARRTNEQVLAEWQHALRLFDKDDDHRLRELKRIERASAVEGTSAVADDLTALLRQLVTERETVRPGSQTAGSGLRE